MLGAEIRWINVMPIDQANMMSCAGKNCGSQSSADATANYKYLYGK
jgi:hypothetical protein